MTICNFNDVFTFIVFIVLCKSVSKGLSFYVVDGIHSSGISLILKTAVLMLLCGSASNLKEIVVKCHVMLLL